MYTFNLKRRSVCIGGREDMCSHAVHAWENKAKCSLCGSVWTMQVQLWWSRCMARQRKFQKARDRNQGIRRRGVEYVARYINYYATAYMHTYTYVHGHACRDGLRRIDRHIYIYIFVCNACHACMQLYIYACIHIYTVFKCPEPCMHACNIL